MQPRRGILLIRLKSIGDIVFTLPVIHALRASFPEERITFLVSSEYSSLLEGFKEVDSTIGFNRSQFRNPNPIKMAGELLKLVRRVRQPRLRLVIDFQGYGETGLLAWISGAPERWGTVYRRGRKWAYTHPVLRDTELHPAANFLAILVKNGVSSTSVSNRFVLPRHAIDQAEAFCAAHGVKPHRPMLFIQPFTSSKHKNWPLRNYLEVAQHWKNRGWQILFGGGLGDRIALEPAQAAGFINCAGVPLLLSAGLAYRSTLVLGGDTGLLHLSVAMGKRIVMLMGSLIPGSAHPFQHREWAVVAPQEDLLDSISTNIVIEHCSKACAELEIPA